MGGGGGEGPKIQKIGVGITKAEENRPNVKGAVNCHNKDDGPG